MKKSEKSAVIEQLKVQIAETPYLYITDSAELSVEEISNFRRKCFEQNIQVKVAKNTLVKKALESLEGDHYEELYPFLVGPTTLLFTDTANAPAKIIKEFRKKHDKPLLKVAYIESSLYEGDDQVETLVNLKSKEELIGDVIALLQSPAKNVISALKSSGGKLAGIVKTLSEREN
ncbi:MAG: 50S ribosomal protein L10 [Chitinophagaceae bacterium]|nr:MAG: 50S ribosomal protein L10 [Chitinophagaceae bacterium]